MVVKSVIFMTISATVFDFPSKKNIAKSYFFRQPISFCYICSNFAKLIMFLQILGGKFAGSHAAEGEGVPISSLFDGSDVAGPPQSGWPRLRWCRGGYNY